MKQLIARCIIQKKVYMLIKIKKNKIIWILCLDFNKKDNLLVIRMIYNINKKIW
jgi:hypothetical protein